MRDFPVSLVKHVCDPSCDDYCFACDRHEENRTSGFYRICWECHHAFVTEADLVTEHNKVLAELRADTAPNFDDTPATVTPDVTSGDDVFCCPLCIHDF